MHGNDTTQNDTTQVGDSKSFAEINADKFNLDRYYEAHDPRSYYGGLSELDYIIPQVANPIFQQLVAARHALTGGVVKVLDLGASYGINGALLKYPITWDMLLNRYQIAHATSLSSEELKSFDHHYYKAWPHRPGIEVLAQDISEPALKFAQESGSIDRGFAINLEDDDPDSEMRKALADVDLVISTGSVGYITEHTFDRIMRCISHDRSPWVASFVLRMFPYGNIAETLLQHGLETEKFEGATFIQRRFANEKEMKAVIDKLHEAGIATVGQEDLGYLHAELFVSRPKAAIVAEPINQLISVASGAQRLAAGVPARGHSLVAGSYAPELI